MQPREKLIQNGPHSLTDSELLAIFLRSGTKQYNVCQLADSILKEFPDFKGLEYASLENLRKINGVGLVKAVELQALSEIGLRILKQRQIRIGQIYNVQDVVEQMLPKMTGVSQEQFWVLFLDIKNQIIAQQLLFIGTINQTVAHPRDIFKQALGYAAVKIILIHNHPSGQVQPSKQDLAFTKRVVLAGNLLEIECLDHLIIGHQDYFSFKANNCF